MMQIHDDQQISKSQEPSRYHDTKYRQLYIKARAYFLSMRDKNRESIEATIKKYQKQEKFERLVAALNLVLGPITNYQVLNLRAKVMFIMKTLFVQAIQQDIKNMSHNERIRYSRTRQHTSYLQSQAKMKLEHKDKISCEINSLLYQDILSSLLLQSQLFQKACDSLNPLFYTEYLVDLLGFFKKEEVKRFAKYFSKNLPYLTFEGISNKIVQLVKLFTIIILRFRITNVVANIHNYNLLNPSSDLLLKTMQELQALKKIQSNPFVYYLSEISIFMYITEIAIIPFSWKNGLPRLLNEVAKGQNIEERKWLLLKTKIKYNLSFDKLLHFLSIVQKNAEEKIHHIFRDPRDDAREADYCKFFRALPYIFLKNESYAEAFQRRGFNQEFNITHIAEGVFKCSEYLTGLMLMSASFRCARYGMTQLKLLQLQKMYAKVLVIKKYEFTYNKMRSSFTSPSQNDIPVTLILGTVDDRLIFCQVAFKNLQESEYINSIQRLALKHILSQPYVILIHAYYDYTPFSRSSLTSLLKLGKKLKTRVYISNLGEEQGENTILFAYIYSKMVKKSGCSLENFAQYFSNDLDLLVRRIQEWQSQRQIIDPVFQIQK